MKRRTRPVDPVNRRLPKSPSAINAEFDAQLHAYVEANCPEHCAPRDGRRAITALGILAYLEAIANGEIPGDPQSARDRIPMLKAIIELRKSES